MQNSSARFLSFEKHAHHNPWLDLLRSLAIVFVLFRHGSGIENNGLSEGFLSNIFKNGWVGVDLFFVLSGYLIASGLIRRSGREDKLFPTSYFKDRILRIVPAYYAVLILCVIGFFPGYQIPSDAVAQSFLNHLLFLQDYTGSDINVVFWSLGAEEKFYIIAPVLVYFLFKPKSIFVCGALALTVLLISPLLRGLTFESVGTEIEYAEFFAAMRSPFHMSMEGFIVGIMVAIVQARGFAMRPSHAFTGLAISATGLFLWLGSHEFYAEMTRVDAWIQPTCLAVLFGFMVLCAVSLSSRPLTFEPFFRVNARLSYALYLIHFPLLPLAFVLGYDQHPLVFWASYVVLSYAAALALHFGVEKPFLRLKESLNDRGSVVAPVQRSGAVMP